MCLVSGEEDAVAFLPHFGDEADLPGLRGREREAAHLNGPGDMRGTGDLAAGEPVVRVPHLADLTAAGPRHLHVENARADGGTVVQGVEEVAVVVDFETLERPPRAPATR